MKSNKARKSSDSPKNPEGIQEKISLRATKVRIQKVGINTGLTGGGYQCC